MCVYTVILCIYSFRILNLIIQIIFFFFQSLKKREIQSNEKNKNIMKKNKI